MVNAAPNVIFGEPPTGAATPLLGAAALCGGALPGGSICGPAAGARAGARALMSFLASPRLARRPRISGPPRRPAARSPAARSAARRPAREQEFSQMANHGHDFSPRSGSGGHAALQEEL